MQNEKTTTAGPPAPTRPADLVADLVAARAAVIWKAMTVSEQVGVRFGLFPHAVIADAERDGLPGHALCVALMKLAGDQ